MGMSNFVTDSRGVTVDLTTGLIASTEPDGTDFTAISGTIKHVGNGWYRCSVTALKGSTNNVTKLDISVRDNSFAEAGDGTSGIYVWGAQLEVGSYATSYIPTTTAAATRSADLASMTGSNFSSWYNQTEGTMVCAYRFANAVGGSTYPSPWYISGNTYTERFGLSIRDVNKNVAYDITDRNVNQFYLEKANTADYVNLAAAYKLNDCAFSVLGQTPQTDTTVTLPTVTQLDIGKRFSGSQLNGHIAKLSFYQKRLSNSELQALSTI